MALIHERLLAIQNEMPSIGKTEQNEKQGYSFRGIDGAMKALSPLLKKHGVIIVPHVTSSEHFETTNAKGNVTIHVMIMCEYQFIAEDGSSICCNTIGEGADTGDKAAYKAMAGAMKYAIFQTFCIPTDEMKGDDPDSGNPEESVIVCEECGKPIQGIIVGGGKTLMPAEIAEKSKAKYGKQMCFECSKIAGNVTKIAEAVQ